MHPLPRWMEGTHAWACAALASRLRCVSAAPFGVPVVPEVYWMIARSSVSGFGCDAGSGSEGEQRVPDDRAAHPLRERGSRLACFGHRQPQGETGEEGHGAGYVHRDEVRHRKIRRELLHRGDDFVPDDRVLSAVVFELLAQLARRVRAGCARRRRRRDGAPHRRPRCAAGSSAARSRRGRRRGHRDRARPAAARSIADWSCAYVVSRPKN